MSKLQENIAKAEAYLARFKDKGVLNRIAGEDVPAADGATFETISPVDLKPLATIAQGKAADIDRAAKAAKAAGWASGSGVTAGFRITVTSAQVCLRVFSRRMP